MGLVQDASSPATSISVQSVQGNTCPSFDPPDNPLFLSMWAADAQPGSGVATPTAASTPSQTWTRDGYDYRDTGTPTVDGQAGIWSASAVGPVSSTTITITNQAPSGFRDAAQRVMVFTGHDPSNPIGATKGNRQNSGSSISDSITATVTGSWGFMVLCDWNQGDPTGWTEGAGQEIIEKGLTFGTSYAFIQRTSPDGVNSTTIDFSITGLPTGGQYHWVIVEVLPDLTAVDFISVSTDVMLEPGQALF